MTKALNYILLLLVVVSVPQYLSGQEMVMSPQKGAVPFAPTDVTAFGVSTTQINLTWTSKANDATGFVVERATSAAGPWTQIAAVLGDITSCASPGLSPATVYFYRVSAYNSSGHSFSDVVSATPLSPLPVGAPGKLTAAMPESNEVKLAWVNNASDATGFKIERCQNHGCSNFTEIGKVAGNEIAYEDKAISPATSYSYRLRAYNSTTQSGYTDIATITTPRKNVASSDAPPMELTANPLSSSKVALNWTAAQKTSSDIAGYNIYQNGERVSSARGTTFTVSDLEPVTLYCFTVAAFDRQGDDIVESTPACVTTQPDYSDQKSEIKNQRSAKPKPNP
jgi:Fibronectin type III domain